MRCEPGHRVNRSRVLVRQTMRVFVLRVTVAVAVLMAEGSGRALAEIGGEIGIGADLGTPFQLGGAMYTLIGSKRSARIHHSGPSGTDVIGVLIEGRLGLAGADLAVGGALSYEGNALGLAALGEVLWTWESVAGGDPWFSRPDRTYYGARAQMSLFHVVPSVGFLVCPCDGSPKAMLMLGIGARFGATMTFR